MRKFLIFYILPFLTILLILLKVPEIENLLKSWLPNSTLYIGIAIAATTLSIHYINVISPFKKFEKIERNKWAMIDLVVPSDSFFKDNKLSVNVMIIKRCFLNSRQPKLNKKGLSRTGILKYHFFQKMLKVIWSFNNNPIDKRLVFTVNQGSSGMAYKTGMPVVINVKEDGTSELNLNNDQKKAISNLEFIISCPIFAFDERYNKLSDKVIGILNVSSSHNHSSILIKTPEDRSSLTSKVLAFSKICSLIM